MEHGLTEDQRRILRHVAREGCIEPGEANSLARSESSASRAVDRLIRRGLLDCHPPSYAYTSDKRLTLWYDHGMHIYPRVRNTWGGEKEWLVTFGPFYTLTKRGEALVGAMGQPETVQRPSRWSSLLNRLAWLRPTEVAA